MIRALVIDRSGRVLLHGDGGALSAAGGEQRTGETEQQAVLRVVREQTGMDLPFFTKLLETDDERWFLVALDSWPPLRQDTVLVTAEEALRLRLDWGTRSVLEWFSDPAGAYVQPPNREAAEA